MLKALVCSPTQLDNELGSTLLWRHDLERLVVSEPREALQLAQEMNPDLVLVDADLPRAVWLVGELRDGLTTRHLSVAVITRGGLGALHMEFVDAGANDILRLPASPDWDERLIRLIRISARKEARFPLGVDLELTRRGAEPFQAMALNLSGSGLLVESHTELKLGEHLRLAFRLPASLDPIDGTGWVVREESPRRYGIEFLYLEGDGLDHVRHFVATAP